VTLFGVSGEAGAAIYKIPWSIAVLTAGIYATARTTDLSVFASGLIVGLVYCIFAFYGPKVVLFMFAQKILVRSFSIDYDILDSVRLSIALTFGVLCGCIALWRYRRQERKAQKS